MKRLLLAAALVVSAATYSAPASAINCPPGTQPKPLPTGQNICVPYAHCDPAACPNPLDEVHCPTDIPVWTSVCVSIFGWD